MQRASAHVVPAISAAEGATAGHAHFAEGLRGRRMITTVGGTASARDSRLRHLRSTSARHGYQARFRAQGAALLRIDPAAPASSTEGVLPRYTLPAQEARVSARTLAAGLCESRDQRCARRHGSSGQWHRATRTEPQGPMGN